ncbi:MAG TPA: tyrosine-type recombinase/integrase [Bryobacteraceae bacterium]|nr:tyrosine-type recombinase/integrase [Bryobacteraceae bacterium]
MNKEALLGLVEQHLRLDPPVRRAHPDEVGRHQAILRYKRNRLYSFVEFWCAVGCPWPIPETLAMEWVSQGMIPERPYRDRHRLFCLRRFLIHLRTIEPATEVPNNTVRARPQRTPRLLTDTEITSLVEATARLRSCPPFWRFTVSTLLGLLASTGMRIGEAVRLKPEDVHLDANPPHLSILDTKFGKSRVVVLHPSVAERLRDYAAKRATFLRSNRAEAFLTRVTGKPLRYSTIRRTFVRLVRRAGIASVRGAAVTLHTFRHSFAVKRLTLWHRAGENVSDLLPHLTVCLGRLDPRDTYWYLTATAELPEAASARVEAHQQEGGEG